ncbi:response regulator, partial [Elusimicrobiota bacterium]
MSGKYILVVDDDPMMVALITERLQAEGCLVTSAGDAEEAYIQAENLRPVIMFLDLQMPGLGSGGDVIRKMRRHPRLKSIPVIVLTGRPPEEAKKQVPPDRLVRLLFKPPDWNLVMKTMRELVWAARYEKPGASESPPPAPESQRTPP